jgi:hypothetical protein
MFMLMVALLLLTGVRGAVASGCVVRGSMPSPRRSKQESEKMKCGNPHP